MDTIDYKAIPCARCEAKVDEECKTIKGEPTDFHVARTKPLADAFNLGRETIARGDGA